MKFRRHTVKYSGEPPVSGAGALAAHSRPCTQSAAGARFPRAGTERGAGARRDGMGLAEADGGDRIVHVCFEGARNMAKEILSEEIWQRVAPCIPAAPHRRRVPGRQPIGDRFVLTGILFVLKTGLPWEELPAELGAGSGMTCLRRLRQWQKEGVWRRIRRALAGLIDPCEIDWRRAEPSVRTGIPRRSRRLAVASGRRSPSRADAGGFRPLAHR